VSDNYLIKQVAAQYIRQCGSEAVDYLIEQAEIADSLGDTDTANEWRDIAAAAQRLLHSN
jgi:hypothetical protein